MLYINLSESIIDSMPEEIRRFPKFIRKFAYRIRKFLGVIYIQNIEGKVLITITSVNSRTLKKIEKYIKIKCIKSICLSKSLLENIEFLEFIKGQDVKIYDGRWLFNQMLFKVLEYICQNKKEKMEYQEISILAQNIDELLVENIRELAGKVRILNIVTTKEEKFKKIEKELYEQQGILININNNYKKSLLKSDVILNIDFDEKELNKYTIPRKSCFINFKRTSMLSKSFEGILVNDFEISIPKKYLKYLISFKNFDNTLLYESFIYKRTICKNIKKEINEDEVSIISLNGKNGRIRKSEFFNLSKNKNNFRN